MICLPSGEKYPSPARTNSLVTCLMFFRWAASAALPVGGRLGRGEQNEGQGQRVHRHLRGVDFGVSPYRLGLLYQAGCGPPLGRQPECRRVAPRVHAGRVAGGDRHHRDPDRAVAPRRPEGPRGRRPDQVPEQPQATRTGLPHAPRHGGLVPAGLGAPTRWRPDRDGRERGTPRLGDVPAAAPGAAGGPLDLPLGPGVQRPGQPAGRPGRRWRYSSARRPPADARTRTSKHTRAAPDSDTGCPTTPPCTTWTRA